MSSLNTTISLKQVQHVAMLVSKHLDLHMPGRGVRVMEGVWGVGGGRREVDDMRWCDVRVRMAGHTHTSVCQPISQSALCHPQSSSKPHFYKSPMPAGSQQICGRYAYPTLAHRRRGISKLIPMMLRRGEHTLPPPPRSALINTGNLE